MHSEIMIPVRIHLNTVNSITFIAANPSGRHLSYHAFFDSQKQLASAVHL